MQATGLVTREVGLVNGARRATLVVLTDVGLAAARTHAQAVLDTVGAVVAGLTRMLGLVDEATAVGPRAVAGVGDEDPLEAAMRYHLAMAGLGHQLLAIYRGEVDGELVDNLSTIVVAQLYLHGAVRAGQLRRHTGMTTGGNTKLLDRLEQAGLTTRVFGPVDGDRRAVSIVLTVRGGPSPASSPRARSDTWRSFARRSWRLYPTQLGLDDPRADRMGSRPSAGSSLPEAERQRTEWNQAPPYGLRGSEANAVDTLAWFAGVWTSAGDGQPDDPESGACNTGCLRGTPEAANMEPCRLSPGRSLSQSCRPWPRPRLATS